MKRLAWMALGCVALTAAGYGCSSADETAPSPFPNTDGDGGDDSSVTASSSSSSSSSGSGGNTLCPEATGVYAVDPATSNLLFLLDRSGSMHLRVSETETRWTLTTAGLADILVTLPSDTVAGLAMFPSGDQPITCCEVTAENYIDCNCAAGELPEPQNRCDDVTYQSLSVGMAPLDATHAQSIIDTVAVSDTEFYWGTPLAPALSGTLGAASTMALAGITGVVLLSDGLPTSCDTSEDPLANDIQLALDAASNGAAAGVRTYVIGIDGEAASSDPATDLAINLSALASAGGTARYAGCQDVDDCAYVVNTDNFETALAEALESIALEAASCTYELPMPNGEPDYDAVNITVTAGGVTSAIAKDVSHENGWDYLPGNDKVQLYGEACEMMKADATAQIEVVVGCKTIEP